ncbi:MAG: hypothetical protein KDI79_09835 [Anaerolineae bacterium]|nr:hypothetical protein [Anaerolineae bacterium]
MAAHQEVKNNERLLLPQELALLAECSRVFQAVGWYGDFDLNQPLILRHHGD